MNDNDVDNADHADDDDEEDEDEYEVCGCVGRWVCS